jgi:hypothetical protein
VGFMPGGSKPGGYKNVGGGVFAAGIGGEVRGMEGAGTGEGGECDGGAGGRTFVVGGGGGEGGGAKLSGTLTP